MALGDERAPVPARAGPDLEDDVLLVVGVLGDEHRPELGGAGLFPRLERPRPCANSFKTSATKREIRIEISPACHPFFTGKQKFIDSAGRIEKLKKKFGDAKDIKAAKDIRAARDVKSLAKKKKSSR